MNNLNAEQKKRYKELRTKSMNADVYVTNPLTKEEAIEFDKLVQITHSGGRRPSKKRSARHRRSSNARKSRATRRK